MLCAQIQGALYTYIGFFMTLQKVVDGKTEDLSKEEEFAIRAEWAANEAKAKANAWLKGRNNDYPKVKDQLDMLWHEIDKNGSISKEGMWYNMILDIKGAYPKPRPEFKKDE